MKVWIWICLLSFGIEFNARAASSVEPTVETVLRARGLLAQAEAARRRGDLAAAKVLADFVIESVPRFPDGWLYRGMLRESSGEFEPAAKDYARAVKLDPRSAEARFRRAVVRFRLGRIKPALSDFDAVIRFEPERKPYLWQRGIALFLDGNYDEARRQFEWHQTVNTNDVENAAWHFLCVARIDGLPVARQKLFSVRDDPRPMMGDVHRMLAGAISPDAFERNIPPESSVTEEAGRRRFYGWLYLGMYRDGSGDRMRAVECLNRAVKEAPKDEYLAGAARLYLEQLKTEAAAKVPEPSGAPRPVVSDARE